MRTPEVCRVHLGSFWEEPLQPREQSQLLQREHQDLLGELEVDFVDSARRARLPPQNLPQPIIRSPNLRIRLRQTPAPRRVPQPRSYGHHPPRHRAGRTAARGTAVRAGRQRIILSPITTFTFRRGASHRRAARRPRASECCACAEEWTSRYRRPPPRLTAAAAMTREASTT